MCEDNFKAVLKNMTLCCVQVTRGYLQLCALVFWMLLMDCQISEEADSFITG